MKNFLVRVLICSLILSFTHSLIALAHIGSPGVLVQKQAGKYQILVSVIPPDVVPGTAKVTVFVESGRVETILARPIYFSSGDEGAPTHDELKPIGENRFEGVVWMMDSGSSSIELKLDGPDGKVSIVAPVLSVPTAMTPMPAGTGFGLAALGILLIVLLITTVGASLADGTLKPGQAVPTSYRRKRLVGMTIAAVLLGVGLTGWRTWWTSWADRYRTHKLYAPLPIDANVDRTADGQGWLTIGIDTSRFVEGGIKSRRLSFLVPDHGKLMHVFLARTPGLDAFAHLHPDRQDLTHFKANLPNLPAGQYLLYADIVFRSGFAESVTDTITIPDLSRKTGTGLTERPGTDKDDSWLVAQPMGVKPSSVGLPHLDDDMVLCGIPGASSKLTDGSTMLWTDKPAQILEAGTPYLLKFAVADAQGKPAPLEPYLGMGGHTAIIRSDGTVYIHLHPVGTYSMAAESFMVDRIADTTRSFHYPDANMFRDSIDRYVSRLKQLPEAEKNKLLLAGMPTMTHAMKTNNMVEFPYAFPRSGHYRIWVQVKRNGQVLTGVFDTQVKE
ncbi:hypothetical protein GCM10028803_42230 [Larkinella knui]|uniref:Uncharacterized protein n=1 Tax=Larkinella knui TaxID=2025310 RepID=A0A3P1CNG4_9BACT|nr:hypothetical protein [Larkinella knui]RRB14852.1 hypothetical protein EHT87_09805 [Larkinella knui]